MYSLTTVMAWKRRELQTKSTVFLAKPLYSELIDSSDSSFCSDGWTSRTSCWPRTSYWRRSTSPCVEDKAFKFESGQNLWNRARPERFNTYPAVLRTVGDLSLHTDLCRVWVELMHRAQNPGPQEQSWHCHVALQSLHEVRAFPQRGLSSLERREPVSPTWCGLWPFTKGGLANTSDSEWLGKQRWEK